MVSGAKKQSGDGEQEFKAALSNNPDIWVEIDADTSWARIQPTRYPDPVFYNRGSDTRFGLREKEIGVCYVAGSSKVAIAETFQHGPGGPGTSVLMQDIMERSLHQLKAARTLKVIDVGQLAACMGWKLREIVQAKGQGSEGYELTQMLSAMCMRHGLEVDGLLYVSTVFPKAASLEGCNLVLFEGRETQLVPVSSEPLAEALLTDGKTAVEFLLDLKLSVV